MRRQQAGGRQTTCKPETTRERIDAVARDLYVRRGFNGFSFGDIAEVVGITRANIHHHYGNKLTLMKELVTEFVVDAEERIKAHWVEGDVEFRVRIQRQVDDLRAFHRRYNPHPGDRNVWSPLSRLRLDLPILGEIATNALERSDRTYDRALTSALRRAIAAGELDRATPVAEVARIFRFTVLCCPPMTQDTGSFDEVGRLFKSLERTILAAWGRDSENCPSRRAQGAS